jgi:hypothetical protein
MKVSITTTLLFISAFCFAQKTTYSFDTVKRDSFFLTATTLWPASEQTPRPQVQEVNQLFRSVDEFNALLESIKKDATKAREEAAKKIKEAEQLESVLKDIEEAADNHRSFLGREKKSKKP